VDGQRGDHVLLAPPYVIDEQAVRTIAAQLRIAVDAAITGARK
jgi:adenosylmethionine-8-amino-7-oxononanoate aminotransferase